MAVVYMSVIFNCTISCYHTS